MSLLLWIVIGAIAGWLAGQIMKGSGYGIVGDIIIGMVGALIGGWLLGGIIAIGGLVGSIILATFGAIVLIFVLRLVRRA
ncbi:MAG: GlsB/YeaQ/YmgE family stress response membrane protein [Alphaproteobacteria bacterium]|nr:GlsB/YeaQ/YmgE family stress response membrane protein [Alphaproteobacteria bacterium]